MMRMLGHCALRVSPSPEGEELHIAASAADADFSEELAGALAEMVEKLEAQG